MAILEIMLRKIFLGKALSKHPQVDDNRSSLRILLLNLSMMQ